MHLNLWHLGSVHSPLVASLLWACEAECDVGVSFQLDRIWRHLGDVLLGLPMGDSLGYSEVGGPAHCGRCYSLAGVLDCIDEERGLSSSRHSVHLAS